MEPEHPDENIEPSPGPWAFHEHVYGLRNVVLDRDGRHLCSHVKHSNGPLMAAAPAMAHLLCDLVAGVPAGELRGRATLLLRLIEHPRQPGDDDEES